MLELDAAIHDVDALVSDEPWDARASSRSSASGTPKPPPGLGLPAPPGLTPIGMVSTPPSLPTQSSTASPIVSIASTSLATAPVIKTKFSMPIGSPVGPPAVANATSTPLASPKVKAKAKASTSRNVLSTPERHTTLTKTAVAIATREGGKDKDVKDITLSSGSTESAAPQTPRTPLKAPMRAVSTSILHDEDFPALDSHKTDTMRTPISDTLSRVLGTSSPKKSLVDSSTKPKRPIILSLNTSSPLLNKANSSIKATATATATTTPIETPTVLSRSVSTSDTNPPSPVIRTVPRSIRLTGTRTLSRSDPAPLASPIVLATNPNSSHLQRPSTPTSNSEVISDSASIVSTSISLSRTSSPPPPPTANRVGTAPVRTTTKSQQRKQRKDQLKVDTVATESMLAPQQETTHAPVMGRKKKQKKPAILKKGPSAAISASASLAEKDSSDTPPTPSTREKTKISHAPSVQGPDLNKSSPTTTSAISSSSSSQQRTSSNTSQALDGTTATATNKKGQEFRPLDQEGKANIDSVDSASASSPIIKSPQKTSVSNNQTLAKSERIQIKDVTAKKEPLLITAEKVAAEAVAQTERSTDIHKGQSHAADISGSALSKIFSGLRAQRRLPEADRLSFFRLLNSDNTKAEVEKVFSVPGPGMSETRITSNADSSSAGKIQVNMSEDTATSILTSDEKKQLYEGKPVRKFCDGSRVLITPNGDFVRNLSQEEEDLYIYYQAKMVSDLQDPRTFIFDAYRRGTQGFTLVNNRAVPNGPPSFFPQTTDGKVHDPVAKIQRDEAISYINQFVLPRLQLDRQSSTGQSARDAAADASLNSLAPFIYNCDVPPTQMYGASGFSSDDAAALLTTSTGAVSSIDYQSLGTGSYHSMPTSTSTSMPSLNNPRNPLGADCGTLSLQSPPPMSVEDSEKALKLARREVEKAEAKLNQVIRNNRRLILGTGH
ncbi:hypothetical protein CFIMG_002442RA [Ceratocystis fimbriata CBS 114723]|uniref:Uncharacterized protein n=1 Tax=Ceratocystis fimbriata CBS 114723 TaxID=1035309 RepID=A0A2C5XB13_9PEZI|nr:hypothetical protein CFIMG_002442RA [Ceratocystis fimbriata CBS 114723]